MPLERYATHLARVTYQRGRDPVFHAEPEGHDAIDLTPDEMAVLARCLIPRSRSELVTLAARAGGDALAQRLIASGCLRLSSATEPRAVRPSALRQIGVPTADRPMLLSRCLQSFARHCDAYGRKVQFVVADGSTDPSLASANREALRAVGAATGHGTLYVGSTERALIRQQAVRKGIPPGVMAWLLPEPPRAYAAGAVRNALLLAAAREPTLMVDDDCVGPVWTSTATGDSNRVRFVGHGEPWTLLFFGTRNEALAGAPTSPGDLLGVHERYLGLDAAAIAREASALDVDEACPDLLASLCSRQRSVVRATWSGLVGDAAIYCPYRLLFDEGAAKQRMVSHPGSYGLALTSREVIRSIPVVTVAHSSSLMTYCTGIDNDRLLTPFSPTGYAEDALFGMMLRWCDPLALFARLPVGIVHDSTRVPPYGQSLPRSATEVRLLDIVGGLGRDWLRSASGEDMASRLRSLGQFFSDTGRMTARACEDRVREVLSAFRLETIRRCEEVLSHASSYPPQWLVDTVMYRHLLAHGGATDGWHIPVELRHLPSAQAIDALRRHLIALGSALSLWPDIWETTGSDHTASGCG
jgi:hypothetical protein